MHPGSPPNYPPHLQHGLPQNGAKTAGSSLWVVLIFVLGAGVLFFGVLVVLAIYGVRKYIHQAKVAEALNGTQTIAVLARTAYDAGDSSGVKVLCASATSPAPKSITMVSAPNRYMSSATDWTEDAATNAGFACLRFQMSYPQYYQYDYKRIGSATGRATGDGFRAIAHGDLNGDGKASTYDLSGKIAASGDLAIAPAPVVTDPD